MICPAHGEGHNICGRGSAVSGCWPRFHWRSAGGKLRHRRFACSSGISADHYRHPFAELSGIAIPFPPPSRKAELSAFPPLAEKGRFPPVIVVDIQAKNTARGLRPSVRGPVVRTGLPALGGGRPGTATGTSLQQDGETCRKVRQRGCLTMSDSGVMICHLWLSSRGLLKK